MILQRISRGGSIPPGGYSFTCPETGYRFSGYHNADELYRQIEAHYRANDIPLPDNWRELVEDQMCQRLPAGWCQYDDGTPAAGITEGLSFDRIMQGITSLSNMAAEAAKGGDPFVDQDEAEKRADICTRCFYNVPSGFCMGCGGARVILDMVAKVKGNRTTSKDGALQNCGVCGCRNDAIVHVKRNILLSGENPDTTNKRPAWCWLKNPDLTQASSQLHL
mgnify:CR=1 FL=1